MSAWNNCIKLIEPLSEYIPDTGKADTVGGEMTRAVNRICYRYFNDGEKLGDFDMYDMEPNDIPSVTYAAAYIFDEYGSFGPLGRKLKNVVEELVFRDFNDSAYERVLVRLCEAAREIYDNNPQIFSKSNSDDLFDHGNTAEEIKDKVYTQYLPEEDEDNWDDDDEDFNY